MNRTTIHQPSTAAALSPSGLMTAQGRGNLVLLWWHHDHGSATPLRSFRNGYGSPLAVVNWSPDGTLLLAGSATGEVLVWQVRKQTCLLANRLPWMHEPILEIVGSPDGTYVAALTVQIWDVATRTCVALLGCSAGGTALEWSPDGRHVMTGSGDRWNIASFV